MSRCPSAPLFLLAVLAFAFPALGRAAGFDCAKATSRVEKTICASPGLSSLDERLAGRFKDALAGTPEPAAKEALRAEQRAWLKKRDACADAACLERTYVERLSALGSPGTAPGNAIEVSKSDQPREAGRLKEALARRAELFSRLKWPESCEEDFRESLEAGNEAAPQYGPAGGESEAAGVEYLPLPGGGRLALIQCGLFAYQGSFAAVIFAKGENAPGRIATFKEYDRDDAGKVETAESVEIAGTPSFDPAAGVLTVLTKARGVGDCGSLVRYAFKDGQAQVVSARAQACFDDQRKWIGDPEKWPAVEHP